MKRNRWLFGFRDDVSRFGRRSLRSSAVGVMFDTDPAAGGGGGTGEKKPQDPAEADRALAALRETNTRLNAQLQADRSRLGRILASVPDVPQNASDQQLADFFAGLVERATPKPSETENGDPPPNGEKKPGTVVAKAELERLKAETTATLKRREDEYSQSKRKLEQERDDARAVLNSDRVRIGVLDTCAKLESVDGPAALSYLNSTECRTPWKLVPGETPGELQVVGRQDGQPYFSAELGRLLTPRDALAELPKHAPWTARATVSGGGGGGQGATNGTATHVRTTTAPLDWRTADPRALMDEGVKQLDRASR